MWDAAAAEHPAHHSNMGRGGIAPLCWGRPQQSQHYAVHPQVVHMAPSSARGPQPSTALAQQPRAASFTPGSRLHPQHTMQSQRTVVVRVAPPRTCSPPRLVMDVDLAVAAQSGIPHCSLLAASASSTTTADPPACVPGEPVTGGDTSSARSGLTLPTDLSLGQDQRAAVVRVPMGHKTGQPLALRTAGGFALVPLPLWAGPGDLVPLEVEALETDPVQESGGSPPPPQDTVSPGSSEFPVTANDDGTRDYPDSPPPPAELSGPRIPAQASSLNDEELLEELQRRVTLKSARGVLQKRGKGKGEKCSAGRFGAWASRDLMSVVAEETPASSLEPPRVLMTSSTPPHAMLTRQAEDGAMIDTSVETASPSPSAQLCHSGSPKQSQGHMRPVSPIVLRSSAPSFPNRALRSPSEFAAAVVDTRIAGSGAMEFAIRRGCETQGPRQRSREPTKALADTRHAFERDNRLHSIEIPAPHSGAGPLPKRSAPDSEDTTDHLGTETQTPLVTVNLWVPPTGSGGALGSDASVGLHEGGRTSTNGGGSAYGRSRDGGASAPPAPPSLYPQPAHWHKVVMQRWTLFSSSLLRRHRYEKISAASGPLSETPRARMRSASLKSGSIGESLRAASCESSVVGASMARIPRSRPLIASPGRDRSLRPTRSLLLSPGRKRTLRPAAVDLVNSTTDSGLPLSARLPADRLPARRSRVERIAPDAGVPPPPRPPALAAAATTAAACAAPPLSTPAGVLASTPMEVSTGDAVGLSDVAALAMLVAEPHAPLRSPRDSTEAPTVSEISTTSTVSRRLLPPRPSLPLPEPSAGIPEPQLIPAPGGCGGTIAVALAGPKALADLPVVVAEEGAAGASLASTTFDTFLSLSAQQGEERGANHTRSPTFGLPSVSAETPLALLPPLPSAPPPVDQPRTLCRGGW